MSEKGYDFATGKPVDLSKPEEKVRQDYERILVNDFGYPKEALDIEVSIQMGSSKKSCDIAIYESEKKEKIIGIVETKAPKVTGGLGQLDSYISATGTCQWGILTNGEETQYAIVGEGRKIEHPESFVIPKHGETGATVLNYDDLIEASNLKWAFRHINQRLYANALLPRTEKQGAEMVRLIFCKLTDEYNGETGKSTVPHFQVRYDDEKGALRKRVNQLWEQTKSDLAAEGIFGSGEEISIDNNSLVTIVAELQRFSLLKTDRDAVGDAFEIFAERQFAGAKGQFFTPRSVVRMVINMLNPKKGDKIIDPACGSGGFLIAAYYYMTEGISKDKEEARSRIARNSLFGIEIDADLVKICKAQMAIIGDGKANVVRANSLQRHGEWGVEAQSRMTTQNGELNEFDIVVTNPPFGSNIKVEGEDVLKHYALGHRWRKSGKTLVQEDRVTPKPPQVLFIERCLELLKPGGKLGIVLPDGLLGNTGDAYIRQFIAKQAKILAVVDCPVETFLPHTGTKTSVLILQKHPADDVDSDTFLAISEKCGHNARGKPTKNPADFPEIAGNYRRATEGIPVPGTRMGFHANKEMDERMVMVPRYYDPLITKEIAEFDAKGWNMVSIRDLVDQGDIEVGGLGASPSSEEYDPHGEVRFVKTSDISGYEIIETTLRNVSLDTWAQYREKQDLQKGDILFVKDGDIKIGNCAILLNDEDLRISVQSHFNKIRAVNMDCFLLLWALSTPIVRKQIRQRVFNQSTLSTIGERIYELKLPLPETEEKRCEIIKIVEECITSRRESLRRMNGTMV